MSRWRPQGVRISLLDAAIVCALMVVALLEIFVADLDHPLPRAGFAAVSILGLLVRRTLPLVAAGVVSTGVVLQSLLVESPDEVGVLLAVILAAFAVGAYAVRRDQVLGSAALVGAVTAAVLTDPSDSTSNLPETAVLFVGLPLALGYMFRRTHRDIAALELETVVLADEAATAAEGERRRIARELHDVVAHAVTLIAVQAEAGSALFDTDREAARRSLDAIGAVSREALVELRRMLDLLADGDSRTPDGGLERLPALVAGTRAAGLRVEVSESGTTRRLPPGTDHCAFRVLQEGLTNALRHASDSTVQVRLAYAEAELALTVDSVGLRHTSAYGGTGRGLAGVRERVLALGGTLSAGSTDAGGFRLAATLPLEAAP